RTPCVVSGDTTAEAKPSPMPILHACALLDRAPQRTLYVGDDRRDIIAGQAAGTLTAAVSYGYLGSSGPVDTWGADFIANHPADLATYLFSSDAPR
ncbi:MAG: HAD-IA family hydrolase, partial [Azonexus sp.]